MAQSKAAKDLAAKKKKELALAKMNDDVQVQLAEDKRKGQDYEARYTTLFTHKHITAKRTRLTVKVPPKRVGRPCHIACDRTTRLILETSSYRCPSQDQEAV